MFNTINICDMMAYVRQYAVLYSPFQLCEKYYKLLYFHECLVMVAEIFPVWPVALIPDMKVPTFSR